MDNRKAFLDMIAWAEIGPELLSLSDDGYNVSVGSTPARPILFGDYSSHPRLHNDATNSDAAGRYQLMGRYWSPYCHLLGLHDFSPASQDAIALQQIRERGALPLIDGGSIELAIHRVSNIWASLPGNDYGQPQKKLDGLLTAFRQAGGVVA